MLHLSVIIQTTNGGHDNSIIIATMSATTTTTTMCHHTTIMIYDTPVVSSCSADGASGLFLAFVLHLPAHAARPAAPVDDAPAAGRLGTTILAMATIIRL